MEISLNGIREQIQNSSRIDKNEDHQLWDTLLEMYSLSDRVYASSNFFGPSYNMDVN